jgi:hypothetical protein
MAQWRPDDPVRRPHAQIRQIVRTVKLLQEKLGSCFAASLMSWRGSGSGQAEIGASPNAARDFRIYLLVALE